MKKRWVGKDLQALLTKSLDELVEIYPEHKRETLARKQRHYKAKGNDMEKAEGGRLSKQWEVSAFNRETNEWDTTLNSAYEYAPDPGEIFKDWQQATPARITPSRRKPIQRDHKTLLVFGDMQIDYRRIDNDLIPIHSEPAIQAVLDLARDLRPDEMVNLGDTVDLSALSRFNKDSDHFYRTLGPSFQRIHDIYAQLRSDNPESKITEVDSNHHKRLTDFVLKQMPDFYGVRQAGNPDDYPVMTYPYLANLKHVGVNWVGGYGAATYEYKPDLAFIHGEFAVSNGSTAAKLSKANPDRNIVQGHVHRMETQYRTTRTGKYLGAFTVGALCRLDGVVPSYHSSINEMGQPVGYNENWQAGAMIIRDYGDGNYEFNHIPIVDGKIRYEGNEYGN
jgi:hypothetical protein